MTRLIIALRELGFKNREILALLAEHKNEIEKLFQSALLGNVEPSLEMLPFSETFSNRKNVELALNKADFILEDVRTKIESVTGVNAANVNLVFEPAWDQSMMSEEARVELGFD